MNREDIASLLVNIRLAESDNDADRMIQVVLREFDALEAINAERGKVIAEQHQQIVHLRQAVLDQMEARDAMKKHIDEQAAEIEKRGNAVSVLLGQVRRLTARVDELESEIIWLE